MRKRAGTLCICSACISVALAAFEILVPYTAIAGIVLCFATIIIGDWHDPFA
jgi:hypothetical protein